jgi:hypothetical protein
LWGLTSDNTAILISASVITSNITVFFPSEYYNTFLNVLAKLHLTKQFLYRPGQALRPAGGLGFQNLKTVGTGRW